MSSCQVAVVLGMAVSLVDGARTQMGQGTWPGLWGLTATASLCIDCGDPYTLGGLIGARWPCPVRSCSSLIPCRVVRSWRSFIEGAHGAEHGAGGDSSGAIVRYDLNVCFVSSAAHPCAVRYQLPLVLLDCQSVGLVYQPSFALEIPHFLEAIIPYIYVHVKGDSVRGQVGFRAGCARFCAICRSSGSCSSSPRDFA